MPNSSASRSGDSGIELEAARLRLEQTRYRSDVLKWGIIAVGAVVSFIVIDYGKLQLERFRATAENQRELLNAYLAATESPEPDVWKRKLNLIINSTGDEHTQHWAERELEYIDDFAALDTLYRETLKVSSQLVEPHRIEEPDRVLARARYNQLYWADLPYAGESEQVADAMIKFRTTLMEAEADVNTQDKWDQLNIRLIELSKALRDSSPRLEKN